MIIFPIVILFQLVYFLIMALACCERTNSIVVFARNEHNKFKWNGLIAFFNESYLLLCFCAAFNLSSIRDENGEIRDVAFHFSNSSMVINSCLAIVIVLVVILVPILINHAVVWHWHPLVSKATTIRRAINKAENGGNERLDMSP